MELPFTPFEATSITILFLAASYYAGHWIGFKVGALETIKFFEDQGYIEFDKEEEEEDDE
jgi:hypothetical protein